MIEIDTYMFHYLVKDSQHLVTLAQPKVETNFFNNYPK